MDSVKGILLKAFDSFDNSNKKIFALESLYSRFADFLSKIALDFIQIGFWISVELQKRSDALACLSRDWRFLVF